MFPYVVCAIFVLAAIPSFHHFFSDVSFAPLVPWDPSLGYAAHPRQFDLKVSVFLLVR